MRLSIFLLSTVILTTARLSAETPVPIINQDFEEGKKAWADDKGTTEVLQEAAAEGKGGLRVTDPNETDYIRVMSEPEEITPGKTYRLDFQANQVDGHGVNAILWFLDENLEIIKWPDDSRVLAGPAEDAKGWEKFSISAKAPANAVYAQIHVQSNRIAVGTVDFDSFTLTQLD